MNSETVTVLLHELAGGDKTALDRLMPLVYAELRQLAGRFMSGERQGHTLQPTALVHEAYARMVDANHPEFQSRAHFLAVAARVMRQILVDYARAHKAGKRGGGVPDLSIEDACNSAIERPSLIVALSDAMDALEAKDPRKARLIEMRFFGGLTLEESAAISDATLENVRYELRLAQAWLHRELTRNQEIAKTQK